MTPGARSNSVLQILKYRAGTDSIEFGTPKLEGSITEQQQQQQHNTTQHNTTQHNTTQHNTTIHNTTIHNTTQHNTTQQHINSSSSTINNSSSSSSDSNSNRTGSYKFTYLFRLVNEIVSLLTVPQRVSVGPHTGYQMPCHALRRSGEKDGKGHCSSSSSDAQVSLWPCSSQRPPGSSRRRWCSGDRRVTSCHCLFILVWLNVGRNAAALVRLSHHARTRV